VFFRGFQQINSEWMTAAKQPHREPPTEFRPDPPGVLKGIEPLRYATRQGSEVTEAKRWQWRRGSKKDGLSGNTSPLRQFHRSGRKDDASLGAFHSWKWTGRGEGPQNKTAGLDQQWHHNLIPADEFMRCAVGGRRYPRNDAVVELYVLWRQRPAVAVHCGIVEQNKLRSSCRYCLGSSLQEVYHFLAFFGCFYAETYPP